MKRKLWLYLLGLVVALAAGMQVAQNEPTKQQPEVISVNQTDGVGYHSFAAFKKAMGPAGEGMAWHHIVEQTPGNVERFGPERIHNTHNLVKLPHGAGTIHAKVSGYYSSKDLFTGGKTVRQWLSGRSFEEQYEFGIKALHKFGWKDGEN